MRLTPAAAAIAAFVVVSPVAAQPPASSSKAADAYYEFMLARRLEADGNETGALAALERAGALDPSSSEILAERAGLHARQNDAVKARDAAEKALAINKDNIEAHRILALVFSAWSEGAAPAPPGETAESLRAKAIEHLQAIRTTPAMVTDLSLQLTYGRLLLRAGQTDQAVTQLEAVASQAPYIAEPFVLLAEAHTSKGRLMDAAQALTQAAEVNPRYYVSLGDLYERAGRWAAAAGAYGQAIEGIRQPSRDLRLRHITALLNVPGGVGAARAKENLLPLLKSTPDDTRLLYLLSMSARQLGDHAGAEEAARKLLSIDPTSLTGLNALARSLSDRYQYRQVVDLLQPLANALDTRARGREDEAAAALAQLGIAQLQLARYAAAVATFEAARRLVPADLTYDLYLAQTLIAAQAYDRAIAVSGESLARHPNDLRLIRLRADALARAGRAAEAIGFLEGAIKLESRSPQLALALADAYAAEKRFDDAVKVIEQAETAFGEDEEFTYRLAGVLEEAGRYDAAERELRALVERDPMDATALNALGYLLADRTTRADEAVKLLERALTVDPDNPAFLDSMGWALFKVGKTAEAAEPLRRAAEALPGNSVIQDHHGDLLGRLGQWAAAAEAYERALAGDGESIDRARVTKKLQDARRRR